MVIAFDIKWKFVLRKDFQYTDKVFFIGWGDIHEVPGNHCATGILLQLADSWMVMPQKFYGIRLATVVGTGSEKYTEQCELDSKFGNLAE